MKIRYRFTMIKGLNADYSERYYRVSGEFIRRKCDNQVIDSVKGGM